MKGLYIFMFPLYFGACPTAFANVFRVNNNYPTDVTQKLFKTLTEANNSPLVMAGDTLMIEASTTVYAKVDITKPLTLIGPGYFYKVNNGSYQLWQYDVSFPENSFIGKKDSTYSFFSISKDVAGNLEDAKTNPERIVTVKLVDSADKTCQGGSTTFSATSAGTESRYQWQVNIGDGFVDIIDNAIYAGANTTQLTLTAPPTICSNYKYRCKISNGTVTCYSSLHAVRFVTTWTGAADDAWETAANWNCGLVPDENTDVIISPDAPVNPVLSVTASCKSLTIYPVSKVIVKTGAKLIITGKL